MILKYYNDSRWEATIDTIDSHSEADTALATGRVYPVQL